MKAVLFICSESTMHVEGQGSRLAGRPTEQPKQTAMPVLFDAFSLVSFCVSAFATVFPEGRSSPW